LAIFAILDVLIVGQLLSLVDQLPATNQKTYNFSNFFSYRSPSDIRIRFIEDNWGLKRIGDQSFDAKAGSVMNMFDFTTNHYAKNLFLDTLTGSEK
jgi:phospholipase C